MSTYVDTSVLLKRVLIEEGSDAAHSVWAASDVLCSTEFVIVEARAALAAARRAGRIKSSQHEQAKSDLVQLLDELAIIEVTHALVIEASELAEAESLRGYDAVHLATALTAGATLFASADAPLCAAADRRGMAVANPLSAGVELEDR